MKNKLYRIFGLLIITMTVSCGQELRNEKTLKTSSSDSAEAYPNGDHGYNELANEDSLKSFTISDFNTDNPDQPNIERPEKSLIITPSVDTSLLFQIWTLDPNGPHADFWFQEDYFYIVDYDGNGEMPYKLSKDSLTVYYNDFVQYGKIKGVSDSKLDIKWNDSDETTSYVRWEN